MLGLLPALGGGLGELARTGQAARLLDGYIARYLTSFDRVRYFTYLVESLGDFTADAAAARPCRRGGAAPAVEPRAPGRHAGVDGEPLTCARARCCARSR